MSARTAPDIYKDIDAIEARVEQLEKRNANISSGSGGTITPSPGTVTDISVASGANIQLSKLAVDPLNRANHTGTQLAATISDFATQLGNQALSQHGPALANLNLGGFVASNSGAPVNPSDLTTKSYVDGRTASPAGAAGGDLGGTYPNPTVTKAQAGFTIGGVAGATTTDVTNASTNDRNRSNHTGTQLAATISDFNTARDLQRLDQHAAPTASVTLGNQKLINVLDPTLAQDGATKNYVDTNLATNATADRNRANHTGTQLAATISNFDTQVRTNPVSAMAVPTADWSNGGFKITNVATPTLASDVATKGYADSLNASFASTAYVDAGDTAAKNRANHTGTQLAATISDFATAAAAVADGRRLDQHAAPTAAVAFGSQKATGLADPTTAQDAATKNYVDTRPTINTGSTAGGDLTGSYPNPTVAKASGASFTISGFASAPNYTDYRVTGSLTNKVVTAQGFDNAVSHLPMAKELWHDVLAFNRSATPTFETYDAAGAAWGASALDTSPLFAHLEDQGVQVADGVTKTGARWTWNSANWQFCGAHWLMLGYTYTPTPPNRTILWETSADGITWTQRHLTANDASNNDVKLFYTNDNGSDAYIRLTITTSTAQPIILASIRWHTARWGNQGRGSELSLPYLWNSKRQLGLGLGPLQNAWLTIGSQGTTADQGIAFGNDVNVYRGGANILKTDDAFEAGGTIKSAGVLVATATDLSNQSTIDKNRANHTGTQLAATISDFSTAAAAVADGRRLDQHAAPTASVTLGNQKIINVLDPTLAQDAATKNYVDTNLASGSTADRNRANHTGTQLAATISDFNTAVRTNTLTQMAAPTADLYMAGFKITNMNEPVGVSDAATRTTVDNARNFAIQRANHTGTQLSSTISDFTAAVRTNPVSSMAASTADWSNGGFKITSLATPTLANDASTKDYADQVARRARAGTTLHGGGNRAFDGSGISWSTRFITISNGKGANWSTTGYFDITMPADGTVITGVATHANITVASGKIPLAAWDALYYILPIGGTSASVNANFRVVAYNLADYDIPPDWVLVAVRNGDGTFIKWGDDVFQATNAVRKAGKSGGGVDLTDIVSFNAKGDLLVGTADDTHTPVTVGANDTVLLADSTQASGVRWSSTIGGAAFANQTDITNAKNRANHTGTQLAATISDFNTARDLQRLDQHAAPTASVNLNSQKLISVLDPTLAQDAATKNYVDTNLATNATNDRSRANHTGTQLAATISNFDTQVRTSRLDQMAAPTAPVAMGSQRITGVADPTGAQDAATKAYTDLRAGNTAVMDMPVGSILDYGGSTPPGADWLICNGQAVGRGAYPDLFTAIGVTYGAGDGSTTFNVPDFSGRVSVGSGTATGGAVQGATAHTLGQKSGDESKAITIGEIPSHDHGGGNHSHGIDNQPGGRPHVIVPGSNARDFEPNNPYPGGVAWNEDSISFSGNIVSPQGGGGSLNRMQPYLVATKIIKALKLVTAGTAGLDLQPIGGVQAFAQATPPAGYLLANGQLVSRTLYSELFTIIGTTFGVGDGSTTFALPTIANLGANLPYIIKAKMNSGSVVSSQRKAVLPFTADGVATTWTLAHTVTLNANEPFIGMVWEADGAGNPVRQATADVLYVDSTHVRVNFSRAPASGLKYILTVVG